MSFVEPRVQCGCRVYWQTGHEQRDCTLHVKNGLMTSYIGKGNSRAWFASWRTALKIRVRTIGAMLVLDRVGDQKLYIPMGCERHLLTGRDCPELTRHIEFEVQERWSPEFFVLLSRFEEVCLQFYFILDTHVHYLMHGKKKLTELLRQKKQLFRHILLLTGLGTCKMENVAGTNLTVYTTTLRLS